MNHDENPNDSALTAELRHALSELAMPERPSLAGGGSHASPASVSPLPLRPPRWPSA
jgi:hypothetical protein